MIYMNAFFLHAQEFRAEINTLYLSFTFLYFITVIVNLLLTGSLLSHEYAYSPSTGPERQIGL